MTSTNCIVINKSDEGFLLHFTATLGSAVSALKEGWYLYNATSESLCPIHLVQATWQMLVHRAHRD